MTSLKRFSDQALAVFTIAMAIAGVLLVLDITIGGGAFPGKFGAFHPLLELVGQYAGIVALLYIGSLALRVWKSKEFWQTVRWIKDVPRADTKKHEVDLDDELELLAANESPDGWVYLIRGPQGWYKIGHTKNPDDRRRTFGVKLPFDVAFEHLIKCDDRRAVESRLHEVFAHRRGQGEWFTLTPEDVVLIKSIKEM